MPIFSEMRLVGGTALALQYGHRKSIDLDFFGTMECDPNIMEEQLESIGHIVRIKSTQSIRVYQIDGVKVDFVDYRRYPWIDQCVSEGNIRLASPKDIAAMKINAVEGRGSKKDFIDVFYLLNHHSLEEILSFYKQKYPEHNVFRALMSLTYFEDAEMQPLPFLFNPTEWTDIKSVIVRAVGEYTKHS
ncbi:MAG: nucleotidyl transferase AbiEii/AbiGii toxin family protein [Alloprevotella sp.]